jgi:hypothetical protein
MGVSRLDELFAATKRHEEWLVYFGTLTFVEFMQLYDQAVERFPASVRHAETFERHYAMMTAFATKLMLAGHVMWPATMAERRGLIHMAETFYAWISKLPDEDARTKLAQSWDDTLKYCAEEGYFRGGVFHPSVPQKQFKDR